MERRKGYKSGLRKKLVLFTTVLATITYATSAIFIYFVYPMVQDMLPVGESVFNIVTLGLGIMWSGILAFFAAGYITKSLQKLEKVALQAANGDLSEDVELSKSDDEVRALGIAFNQMLASLRDMVQKIEGNFVETNEKVVLISQESGLAARQADAVSRTVSEIAAGADNSAVAIQTTVESLDEIVRIAGEVQDRSQTAEKISQEMVADLQNSRDVIHSLVSGISQLAEGNQKSLETVRNLEENAKEVEAIIKLVGDIAAQTNLLALNASIEAARAGEHGKGFAVVADEVRKLADESAKAVKGISELIENIQDEVQKVVHQITRQVDSASKEASKGTKTNEVIEEMTKTVHEMVASVGTITGLVDQQMASIHQTSSQTQEVAAIAEETSAGAQEVAASTVEQTSVIENVENLAQELKGQADKLKETISRFKL